MQVEMTTAESRTLQRVYDTWYRVLVTNAHSVDVLGYEMLLAHDLEDALVLEFGCSYKVLPKFFVNPKEKCFYVSPVALHQFIKKVTPKQVSNG